MDQVHSNGQGRYVKGLKVILRNYVSAEYQPPGQVGDPDRQVELTFLRLKHIKMITGRVWINPNPYLFLIGHLSPTPSRWVKGIFTAVGGVVNRIDHVQHGPGMDHGPAMIGRAAFCQINELGKLRVVKNKKSCLFRQYGPRKYRRTPCNPGPGIPRPSTGPTGCFR